MLSRGSKEGKAAGGRPWPLPSASTSFIIVTAGFTSLPPALRSPLAPCQAAFHAFPRCVPSRAPCLPSRTAGFKEEGR